MTFSEVLSRHLKKYPLMEPKDCTKLAYQHHFGPVHMLQNREEAGAAILEEWRALEGVAPTLPEDIGNGLCRFPLSLLKHEGDCALLARLFETTARQFRPRGEFEEILQMLEGETIPGMAQWLAEYRQAGCPPLGHSEGYRAAYSPHYRLLKGEYVKFFPIFQQIVEKLKGDVPVILAIDGRCGSGKTTLAQALGEVFSAPVVHMDDYHVPVDARPANWLKLPAANMDLARFEREVLQPAREGEEIVYRPFRCQTGRFLESRRIPPAPVLVVEGSYSHHPALTGYYADKIFLTCPDEVRIPRLRAREGDYFPRFEELWMPLEENFFRIFDIPAQADLVADTGEEGALCAIISKRP